MQRERGVKDDKVHHDIGEKCPDTNCALAGVFASTLYTLGVIGVGILAIPTLTGSAAYALAETFSWKEGLD